MEKGKGKIRRCARKRKMLKRKKYEEILKIRGQKTAGNVGKTYKYREGIEKYDLPMKILIPDLFI